MFQCGSCLPTSSMYMFTVPICIEGLCQEQLLGERLKEGDGSKKGYCGVAFGMIVALEGLEHLRTCRQMPKPISTACTCYMYKY